MGECPGANPASKHVAAVLMRADGLTREEIGRRLGVKGRTVSTYVARTMRGLRARSVDEAAAIILGEKPLPDEPVVVNARDIIADFAAAHGFRYADLVYGGRQRDLVQVRHDCIRHLAALDPTLSTWEIGAAMRVDHTTVSYVLGRMKRKPTTLWREAAE